MIGQSPVAGARLRVSTRSLCMSAACLAVLAFAAGNAQAADQAAPSTSASQPTDVDSVVVTGFRKSLESAIAVKRESLSVVEAISAEDIGKLPDESVADALTRLPGLAGQRVQGRYENISIRSLSPDFTATLLNGYLQASTGDNRAAEFDQYPSELISGATVYKTPDASLTNQGLAGTVDLHTTHPLDLKNRVIAINVRGSENSLSKLNAGSSTSGNRISGAYIDQFANGTVGVSLAFAHLDNPEQEQHYQGWWWQGQDQVMPAAGKGAQVLSGWEIYAYSRDQTRDSVMGTLEFKPNANFHSTNDFYYSKYKQTETQHGVEGFLYTDNTGPNLNTTFATIGGALVNTGGTIQGVVPIILSNYNTRNDTLFSYISRNTWDVNGWRLGADFSYSSAERKENTMEQYASYGPNRQAVNITYSGVASGGQPSFNTGLNYADASKIYLGDPAPWGGWGHDGTVHDPATKDTVTEVKFNGAHDVGGSLGQIFSKANFGVDFSERTKRHTEQDYNLFLKGSRTGSSYSSAFQLLLPSSLATGATNLGFGGWGNLIGYNQVGALANYDQVAINDTNQYDHVWEVREDLTTVYAKVDITSQLMGHPLDGNVGFQYVDATQHSEGFTTHDPGGGAALQFAPYSKSVSYGEFLPNLNLRWELPGTQIIRFGAAREMSRPRLADLRANSSAGVALPQGVAPGAALGRWSGSGGNPNLRPWLATAFDLTYEKYFSKETYFAAAFFTKKLESYIYTAVDNHHNFNGYANLSGIAVDPAYGNFGQYTQPTNGQGGKVEGIELSGNVGAGAFVKMLDGFGVSASATRSWTTIKENGPSDTSGTPLLGFSGTTATGTIYYEKNGFSVRVSERYRDSYRGQGEGLFTFTNPIQIAAQRTVDAQVSYDFRSGTFKGLTLLLQGYNLNDEPYRVYQGNTASSNPTQTKYYETYGRVIMFGVNYKM